MTYSMFSLNYSKCIHKDVYCISLSFSYLGILNLPHYGNLNNCVNTSFIQSFSQMSAINLERA